MPVGGPMTAHPYDTVYKVLNAARVRLNDAITTTAMVHGKLLDNNQMFSLELTNTAWRKLQEFLANLGASQFRQEISLYQVPPVGSLDPSIQCRLDWFNFFDGANLYDFPRLPEDFMFPVKLWERQSGSNFGFAAMENMVDGLPSIVKSSRNGLWEWRADAIYLPGSLASMDLKIRYTRYLADFADNYPYPGHQWFQQPVPLMRGLDSLSYFICAEAADAREGLDGAVFRQKGESAARLFMNRDISRTQRVNIRRRSRSGRLEGWGNGDFGLVY